MRTWRWDLKEGQKSECEFKVQATEKSLVLNGKRWCTLLMWWGTHTKLSKKSLEVPVVLFSFWRTPHRSIFERVCNNNKYAFFCFHLKHKTRRHILGNKKQFYFIFIPLKSSFSFMPTLSATLWTDCVTGFWLISLFVFISWVSEYVSVLLAGLNVACVGGGGGGAVMF